MATFMKVSEPANDSACDGSIPWAIAFALASSSHLPITGKINDTENIPAPPINERPSAPDLGTYSDTKPSIVGQKKQIPTAKTAAAPKAAYPLNLLNNNKPIPANKAEKINIPFGLRR